MELTTYDAYGRPKSSVQTILGSVVAGVKQGAPSPTGSGDKLSVTVEGDGVTPVIVEWQATVANNTLGANNYIRIYDGAAATGSRYGSVYVHTSGANHNLNLSGQSNVIPPWTGPKTFYLNLTASTGTITFFGTDNSVDNFMRVRRAHVHTLGNQPTSQLAWIPATLQNSWTNYGTWKVASYLKTAEGMVHITGLVADTAATNAEAIFTLPAGFRPTHPHIFRCDASGVWSRVDIQTSGVVQWQGATGAVPYLSLAGINFLAEQ